MEGPNGELDWLVREDAGVFDVQAFFESFDTIFFGRRAYEKLALAPLQMPVLRPEDRRFFEMLYAMRKYVFTRGHRHVRGNGMVVRNNLLEEVTRIRSEHGKNILVCGGPELFATFAHLDLIDEYVLTVHPVLLTSGTPLFSNNRKPVRLRLIAKQSLDSGVIILNYRPDNRVNDEYYGNRGFQDERNGRHRGVHACH